LQNAGYNSLRFLIVESGFPIATMQWPVGGRFECLFGAFVLRSDEGDYLSTRIRNEKLFCAYQW
jgi:hypothetical protein